MFQKISLFIIFIISCFASLAQIAVKADTVYTMAGAPIANGVVLIKNGKIENVGINLPVPSGYTVHTAKIVTPGLIDVRSSVGLSGAYNIPADQDQLEKSSPIQPEEPLMHIIPRISWWSF